MDVLQQTVVAVAAVLSLAAVVVSALAALVPPRTGQPVRPGGLVLPVTGVAPAAMPSVIPAAPGIASRVAE